MLPTADDFRDALSKIFMEAERMKLHYVDVRSGDLHRRLGSYPGKNHRMPVCCEVMKGIMMYGDKILSQPRSGKGATLVIRYQLPRSNGY